MKRLANGLFTLAFLILASALQAQTAEEIILKYIDAIGGKEKIAALQTVRIENTMSVMGNDAPNSVVIVNGKGYRSESEVMGSKMVQVFTDKSGWMINPMAGGTDAQKVPDELLASGQNQIYIVPIFDYAARGYKAELMDKEKVGDVNAFRVKMTDKANNAAIYYFDPATYYLIQTVSTADMMGQQTQLTMKFTDFKKTDFGWVVPQSTEMDFGGQFSLSMEIKSIEINKDVDMKIFDMPGK